MSKTCFYHRVFEVTKSGRIYFTTVLHMCKVQKQLLFVSNKFQRQVNTGTCLNHNILYEYWSMLLKTNNITHADWNPIGFPTGALSIYFAILCSDTCLTICIPSID